MDQTLEPVTTSPVSSERRGTNQSGMRAQNERLVLTIIRRQGALAKAEIARMTGLSAQTVSVIMRSLEDEGLLLKGEPLRGKVGQPSVPMRLNPDGAFFLGLKIGRRSAEMVLTNFVGSIIAREKKVYPYPDFEQVLKFAIAAAGRLCARLKDAQHDTVEGLGIAMPFQLWDWARKIGVDPATMSAWKDRDILEELRSHFKMPVFIENDATAACSAELVFGKAAMPANVLYLYIGFFIGGGVVLNNGLFTGPSGNAGAIGPMLVPDDDGQLGQLMDMASLVVLEEMLSDVDRSTSSLWDAPEGWDVPEGLLEKWVVRAGNGIARAAHTATAIIDFEAVVIDGWLPRDVQRGLVEQAGRAFDGFDFTGLNRPDVCAGTVGADARALGAASQPLLRRFLIDPAQ